MFKKIWKSISIILVAFFMLISSSGLAMVIVAEEPGLEELEINNYHGEYDGNEHSIELITDIPDGVDVVYGYSGPIFWHPDKPTYTDVGEYEVDVKVKYSQTNDQAYPENDVEGTGTVRITKRALTINPNKSAKAHGEADPEFDGLVTGLVGGDTLDVSWERTGTEEDVGVYEDVIYGDYAAADVSENYRIVENTAYFVIVNPDDYIEIEDYLGVYDGNDHEIDVSLLEGAGNSTKIHYRTPGETGWTSEENPSFKDVGQHEVEVRFRHLKFDNQSNFTFTIEKTGTVAITPKGAQVKANPASKVYGEEDPDFDGEVTGLVNGETLNVDWKRLGTEEDVGLYEDVIYGDYEDDSNYAIDEEKADFTIENTDSDLDIKNYHGTYDGNEHSIELLTGVDDLTEVKYRVAGESDWEDENPSFKDVCVDANNEVCAYEVEVKVTNPKSNDPSDDRTGTGTVTITKKDAIIKADSASKIYGEEDPDFDGEVIGLVDGDTLDVLSWARQGSQEEAGVYPEVISAYHTVSHNYKFTHEEGDFIIYPKDAEVKADPASKVYGEEDPDFDGEVTGLVSNDTLDVDWKRLGTEEDVGVYSEVIYGDYVNDPNYNINEEKATFTIKPTGDVTITYVDTDGNKLDELTLNDEIGKDWTSDQKVFDGYKFKEVIGDTEGVFNEEAQTVTYVYYQEIPTIPIEPIIKGDVVVTYEDTKGNEIDKLILNGQVGRDWTSDQKQFTDYKFKEVIGDTEGIFTDETQTVVYVYNKSIPWSTIESSTTLETEDKFEVKSEIKPKDKTTVPDTGIGTNAVLYTSTLLTSISGLYLLRRKKRNKK